MWTFKRTSFVGLLFQASITLAVPAPPNTTTSPDYVIIGGGPAGFVLAEQLSQDPKVKVVLLEAGPDTAGVEAIDVPGYAPSLLQTPFTWNYTCQPDPNLEGASPMLHQGRGFGGGSAVNYLGHCRGAPSVFDEWAKISGDDGLSWKKFQNDFKATVHYKEVPLEYDPHVNKNAYGNGPIELTSPNDDLGFVLNLIKSWTNVLKLPWVDLNDGTGLGISSSTNVIRANNRTRDYAPQAYGWQLARRPNAQQLYNAEVTKIGFNGKRAVSVTYVDPTTGAVTVLTPKEIIIAAGALGSPKASITLTMGGILLTVYPASHAFWCWSSRSAEVARYSRCRRHPTNREEHVGYPTFSHQ
jgi:choline dehydrogenase-like flavoprotein